MTKEIEVKFEIKNEERLLEILEKNGAKKVAEGLEHNEIFDNGKIRKDGILLRLREYNGKSKLTLKRGLKKDEFKEVEEIDIEIEDFKKAKRILYVLGFHVFWIYEKKRIKFLLDNTKISIDILPFGRTFLEIEGNKEAIRKTIKKLGLDPSKKITDTYLEIYKKYFGKSDEKLEDLVFNKK